MKPSPPKKTGAEALLPGDFQRYRFFCAEKRLLAAEQGLAGTQLERQDRPRKARRKGDLRRLLGGVVGDEERSTAEGAGQALEESAAGVGVHGDAVAHPRHRVRLAIHHLARLHFQLKRLHRRA